MTQDIRIADTPNGKIVAVVPYHPFFPVRARALGGKWEPEAKRWTFDARDRDRLAKHIEAVYGINPLGPPPKLVTVRLRLGSQEDGGYPHKYYNPVFYLGRELASRRERDRPVRLGEGVIVFAGGFPGTGGSRSNPTLSPRDRTILEVRDVPWPLAEKAVDEYPQGVTIVMGEEDDELTDASRIALVQTIVQLLDDLEPEEQSGVLRDVDAALRSTDDNEE